jgi:outer membrane protein TolC
MGQFSPEFEGLLDGSGRPIAPNLTVHSRRGKIERDLSLLASVVDLKKLGLLYFPSGDETDRLKAHIASIGNQLGFEVVDAQGYDRLGVFAFFKAYAELDRQIDALYLPPLWGMDVAMINQFFRSLRHDRIPTITDEGIFLVSRGAFLSASAYAIVGDARFSAMKAARILMGETPADLPVEYLGEPGIVANEETAEVCRVSLPRWMYNESTVIESPPAEDEPVYFLSELLTRALSANPNHLSRSEALRAADLAARSARSEYFPHLNLSASAGWLDDNFVNNSRDELDDNPWATELHLEQDIFSLQTIRAVQTANRRKEAGAVDIERSGLQLEHAVSISYMNEIMSAEMLQVISKARELIDRHIELSSHLQIREGSNEIDYSRWRTKRQLYTSQLIEARGNVRIARVLLNALLNMSDEEPRTLDKSLLSEETTGNRYDRWRTAFGTEAAITDLAHRLAAEAMTNNAELRQIEAQISIAQGLSAENKARFYPTLSLDASLKYADEEQDTPPTFKEERDSWSIRGILRLPLFLGGKRFNEGARLRAELDELSFQMDGAQLRVSGEVRAKFQKLVSLTDMLPAAYRRLDMARKNVETAVPLYDSGEFGFEEMSGIQDELLDAEVSAIKTRFAFYETMADLTRELGWLSSERGSVFSEAFFQFVTQ